MFCCVCKRSAWVSASKSNQADLRALDIENDAAESAAGVEFDRRAAFDLRVRVASRDENEAACIAAHARASAQDYGLLLAMREDQEEIPFQQAGTGTLNTLVLALLSFIAELKPESVNLRHGRARNSRYSLHTRLSHRGLTCCSTLKQAFATSHSPYVIERFSPERHVLLTRGTGGVLHSMCVAEAQYASRRTTGTSDNARRGLSECMLGKGVILVEGTTEFHASPSAGSLH